MGEKVRKVLRDYRQQFAKKQVRIPSSKEQSTSLFVEIAYQSGVCYPEERLM
jgi:hypothetical protein